MSRVIDRCRLRVRSLLRRRSVERELQREIEFHLARQIEENEAAGMSAADARNAALRAFGPGGRIAEECRDTRGTRWLEHLAQDLAYAGRLFRRTPTFAAAALATLTLGFGANAAILTVVHGVLLRPLPFPEPDRLVLVREAVTGGTTSFTAPDYLDLRARASSFADLGAATEGAAALSGSGPSLPERVDMLRASASYFRTLQVQPRLGRLFADRDDREGAERVALLGEGLWRRRFNADPGVTGTAVRVDGVPHTIVGVVPASATLTEARDWLYVPLALTSQDRERSGMRYLTVIGRLREGVSLVAAQHEAAAIMKSLEAIRPGSNTRVSAEVSPLGASLVRDARLGLLLLWSAVGLVLLIACANVANLQLARSAARRKELALRLSLGATRGRIVRQLLAEHVALGAAGALLGAAAAFLLFDALVAMLPAGIPRIEQARMDLAVLSISLGLGVLTSLVFGLVPALHMSRPDLQDSLKEGGRTMAAPSRRLFGSALVVGEISLSLVLLASAGLLVRSFLLLQDVSPGFETSDLLTARLSLPAHRYPDGPSAVRFYERLVERLNARPGVSLAAATSQFPLDGGGPNMTVAIEGRPKPAPGDWEQWPIFHDRAVTPGYRATLGLELIDGRDLTEADAASGPARVALINETAARRYWPDERAVGERIQSGDGDDRPVEIVGVISDTKHFGLDQDSRPEFFLPIAQASSLTWEVSERSLTILLKTDQDPAALVPALAGVVRELDPELPLHRVRTMDEVLADGTAPIRSFTTLLTVFGAMALALAAVGIYGLIASIVQQRQHEFGVRIALGATAAGIRRLVVGRGMVLAAMGVVLGVAGAIGATRALQSLLFEVSRTDPLVLTAVGALLLAVAAAACWIPALRAARVNPLALLRST